MTDGAAVSKFLRWLEIEAPKGGVDELSAAARLQAFREEDEGLKDLSFDTISAAAGHAALWTADGSSDGRVSLCC